MLGRTLEKGLFNFCFLQFPGLQNKDSNHCSLLLLCVREILCGVCGVHSLVAVGFSCVCVCGERLGVCFDDSPLYLKFDLAKLSD